MTGSPTQSDLYRRCARRVRARYADRPRARVLMLCELSHSYDRATQAQSDLTSVQSSAGVRAFVRRVEQQIERDGPMLPYSQRRRLLTEAQRQGIRRFDANLIIAAVQERAPESPSAETNEAGRSFLASAATVLLVQSAILAGAALIYFS